MRARIVIGFLMSALVVHSAPAVEIWATSFSAEGTDPDQLIRFESTTPGAVTVVGSTGLPEDQIFDGLDFDASGNLFAYSRPRDFTDGGALYRVDTATGAATLIGGGGLDAGGPIVDIAFNPGDSTMYAMQLRGSAQNRATILYSLDLLTGAATRVGEVLPFGLFPSGLAADGGGTLFILDALGGQVGSLSGLTYTALSDPTGFNALTGTGITIDWSRDGAMYMSGLENFFPGAPLLPESQFWTVDPVSGAGTLVGTVADGQSVRGPGDIAIRPALVPEPTVLALVLLGIGLTAVRRPRRASLLQA